MNTTNINYKRVCVRLAYSSFVQREIANYLREVLDQVFTEEIVNTMLEDSKVMFEKKMDELSMEDFQQLVNKEILDALKD